MSYRLVNANDLAIKYPEVNEMPCVYVDLPDGLDNKYHAVADSDLSKYSDKLWKLAYEGGKNEVLEQIKAEIRELDDINPDYPMDRTIHVSRNEVLEVIDNHISKKEG